MCAALVIALLGAGCGTGHPAPITATELAEAQTFPYFRVYWAGRSFLGQPLAAADGQKGYIDSVGDSVYYGDCVHKKGLFGGGSCVLPLQVTSVIYRLHSNAALGTQRNIVVRGVPATVYDEGRSIELYTGRIAIDVFSDTFAHAYAASLALRPLNAPPTPGSALLRRSPQLLLRFLAVEVVAPGGDEAGGVDLDDGGAVHLDGGAGEGVVWVAP